MRSKIFIIILFCLFYITEFAKASATVAGFDITPDQLTNGQVYVRTSAATTVTVHIYCTQTMDNIPFTLNIAVGSSNVGSPTPPYTGTNVYANFTITASDFAGGTFLDYVKTITIDARTQSLGNKSLGLFNVPSFAEYQWIYPMLYIQGQGTFDQFPTQYNNTQFNFAIQAIQNGTPIAANDNQAVLTVGQSIYSPDHNTRLTLQNDGNLVVYKKNSSGVETALWSTETQGKGSKSLYFQTDGNLVVYGGTAGVGSHGTGLWASNIYSYTGLGSVTHAFYYLQNDGNFVFYWPNYDRSLRLVYVIAGAADATTSRSTHIGSLNHALYTPAQNQSYASYFTPTPY